MFTFTLRKILNRHTVKQTVRFVYGRSRIGTRDVVGHGINGSYTYKDDVHFPFPAIRFKENTPDVLVSPSFIGKNSDIMISI